MQKRFLIASLLFIALCLVPAGAHLMELPAKMRMSGDDYFTVQQIYRGWALSGIVVLGALISTAGLAWTSRGARLLPWAIVALACVIAAQVVFWTFTFPANQATSNWTVQPERWESLRMRWEYSHAAGALLNLVALLSLLGATARAID